jgi:hypothetical protein
VARGLRGDSLFICIYLNWLGAHCEALVEPSAFGPVASRYAPSFPPLPESFMNLYRLHRRVGRALARVSGIAHRRTPSTSERARPESCETSARHWSIPNASNATADSHGRADWRRRLLAARGQQIHTTSVERADRCAIAILDTRGIVIAWHDHLPHALAYDPSVLSRHMSQFYLPDEIALSVPARHLSIAAEHGVDTQRGWRRRPGGEIFWGVTVMQSILLSDGELLGYSHVTRSLHAPAQHIFRPLRPALPRSASFAAMA